MRPCVAVWLAPTLPLKSSQQSPVANANFLVLYIIVYSVRFYSSSVEFTLALGFVRSLRLKPVTMGRVPGSKNNAKKKKVYKKAHQTWCRPRDVDQVQDDLKREQREGKKMQFDADDDLPGLGQYYCTPCARHFMNQTILDSHMKSRPHKRRLKDVAEQQYSQEEADRAAGKTTEVLPPAHAVKRR